MHKIYEFRCVVDNKPYSISVDQQTIQKIVEEKIANLLTTEMQRKYQIKFSGNWVLREKNILDGLS